MSTRHFLLLALTLTMGGLPPASIAHAQTAKDSVAVVAVVDGFHRALADGDSTRALAALAPDIVILESGGAESLSDYRSHHLPADISFARAVPSAREVSRVVVFGDVAWVTSTSTTQGTFREKPVNSVGAELTVLSRTRDGWRIRAVHWSSRAKR